MKRIASETPFKALGHEDQSSSPSPLEVKDATRTTQLQDAQQDDQHGGRVAPETAQTQTPETHQHRHQNLTKQHLQVNQIEQQQLESLLEGLVNAKVSEHMMLVQEQVRVAQESARHAHEQRLAAENATQKMRDAAHEFQAQATASAQAAMQYAQEQVARDRMSAEAEIKRVREEADRRIAEFASRSPPPALHKCRCQTGEKSLQKLCRTSRMPRQ